MKEVLDETLNGLNRVLLGKMTQTKLALACVLAKGHLLIEDLPGLGKTTLSKGLAKVLGLQFQRVQFTSDLLPADITGSSIFIKDETTQTGKFAFQKGPIFTHLLLADEINRASPKTQSALLEAMEEHQVSIDGKTRILPEPFFVIATQNPTYQSGTFPLPESQLDRFLMRIHLGYPDREAEKAMLKGQHVGNTLEQLQVTMRPELLVQLQAQVDQIKLSDPLLDYIQNILAYTRSRQGFSYGLSPRAGLALVRATQAWALLEQRNHALPEDVQAVLGAVIEHRIPEGNPQQIVTKEILDQVPLV